LWERDQGGEVRRQHRLDMSARRRLITEEMQDRADEPGADEGFDRIPQRGRRGTHPLG
jgi:hypothetical protein